MRGLCNSTKCSAALVASHAARRALQLGECVSSLASGVNLMLTPAVGMSFAVAGMTSATGRCHTFDERADGYARGEACCAASLRREDEAASLLARGSAVRRDGRSASLTAPNGLAQQGLLRASLEDACMAASDLSCAEAHGTGTALGDPIEAGSLSVAILQDAHDAIGVSSTKACAGHSEPAAGATGMLKLALQLQYGCATPNAQLRVLNPHVDHPQLRSKSALHIQMAAFAPSLPWHAGGVSSFGYSGTIAHTRFLSPLWARDSLLLQCLHLRRRSLTMTRHSAPVAAAEPTVARMLPSSAPPRISDGELVRLSFNRDGVAIVELNDVDHFNALGRELSADLSEALSFAAAGPI